MNSKRAIVSRSILGVIVVSAAVFLIAGTASATTPFNCPATLAIDLPNTSTGLPAEWSPPRSTLVVVSAWVPVAGTLSCGYGGGPDSAQVASIYKITTATCTANAARTGFDCDRAP